MTTVGVTSGASVPEELVVAGCSTGWRSEGFGDVEEVEAVRESMLFALPRELRRDRAAEAPAGPLTAALATDGRSDSRRRRAALCAGRPRSSVRIVPAAVHADRARTAAARGQSR